MNTINYKYISDAVEFYSNKGYTYIEVPWYVTEDVMNVTRPIEGKLIDDYYLPKNNKYLVASAEQSFIYDIFKGIISEGYYVAVTPCFRFEKINDIHKKVFIKVELIYISYDMKEDLNDKLNKIILDAKEFFENKLSDKIIIKNTIQDNSVENFDIEYKGYELGSYGIRKYKNMCQWIYGTGCAEPRLSIIQKI
ncbi:hypothetical protein M0Q50_10270 [bacterium]|jgi:hypothetical protein|nr:hypothetical protein [bacterium]